MTDTAHALTCRALVKRYGDLTALEDPRRRTQVLHPPVGARTQEHHVDRKPHERRVDRPGGAQEHAVAAPAGYPQASFGVHRHPVGIALAVAMLPEHALFGEAAVVLDRITQAWGGSSGRRTSRTA